MLQMRVTELGGTPFAAVLERCIRADHTERELEESKAVVARRLRRFGLR